MQVRLFLSSFVLLALGATSPCHAGCGDLTLCVQNPPNPPDPPACTTYHNFCAFVPIEVQAAQPKDVIPEGQPQASPAKPGYSITLNNLSKDQLDRIFGQLGVDTSKIKTPQ